ncbi:hypothetical protein L484_017258 [Morus notabilis]|uniref:Uncharacterized protein n=1 Tax=Morus notabilis TaxID=981085 RepID=W9RR43_9ROSA|nr:hypothetical protein L484_017258 [Morus notabilis]
MGIVCWKTKGLNLGKLRPPANGVLRLCARITYGALGLKVFYSLSDLADTSFATIETGSVDKGAYWENFPTGTANYSLLKQNSKSGFCTETIIIIGGGDEPSKD